MMAAMAGGAGAAEEITLPHDAMIHETRTQTTKNKHQTGFYPGGVYEYTKSFTAPAEWEDGNVFLEFEGVMERARVFVNGDYAGGHPYGYTGFALKLNDFLKYGQPNEIKVVANTSAEESSRWYSGSGIYRSVNLHVGGAVYIPVDGLRIRTPEIEEDCATVQVDVPVANSGAKTRIVRVVTTLIDEQGNTAGAENTKVTLFAGSAPTIRQRILLDAPHLWDVDDPYLYTCCVKVIPDAKAAAGEEAAAEPEALDEAVSSFGVRSLSLNAKHGLRINGRGVKLRGSCIHHDNGVIGAVTLERAEEHRCRQLKEAGFNCIRSSHHPVSRAMLDACDRIGMLVLDELFDSWTRTKNNNDYANYFPDYWEKDAELMVAKDFNHPSVILYISGNEIQEAATPKGAEMNRIITAKLHALDPDRYVTVAINGLLACMDHMGEIMCSIMGITMEQMMEMMAAQAAAQAPGAEASGAPQTETASGQEATSGISGDAQETNPSSGEEDGGAAAGSAGEEDITEHASQYVVDPEEDHSQGGVDSTNASTDFMKGPMADAFAANQVVTDLLEEFGSVTDLVGYNYLTARHAPEHDLFPNRVVLGTETLPSDIVRLWKIVKENPHVIGDMTWTGYDYLGEAGSGVTYYDGRIPFTANWPISISYMGDIDLIGHRRPISYLREIVYGLRTAPYIAVEKLNHYGGTGIKSAWPWKDEIASWTWAGYEGKPAVINVYSNAEEVELFRNGTSLGRKAVSEESEYYAAFETTYQPGELKAISYIGGEESGCDILRTAAPEVSLQVQADRTSLSADGADLSFLTVSLADAQGNVNMQAVKTVTVSVEGAGTLQGFGSADYATENSYDSTTWDTWEGRLLAVVRAGSEPGEITVTFTADGCEPVKIVLTVQ